VDRPSPQACCAPTATSFDGDNSEAQQSETSPSSEPTIDREQLTDSLLFDVSMSDFQQRHDEREHDDILNWTNDECSNSPDNAFWGDFRPACERHDFGYRNYHDQHRFTEATRHRIDDNFLADANQICEDRYNSQAEDQCRWFADRYHNAIRAFGGNWAEHLPLILAGVPSTVR